jgi:hypothetical protein
LANAVRGLCNWVCNLDLTPNPRLGSLSCRAGTAGGAGTPILHAASPWRLYLEVGHAYGYETHARGPSRCFSTSLAPRRAARRRRDSAYHTSVRRSSDCAVVVTAEGASSVARAVPSDSVSCMLAAPRVPTDRFKGGVSAQGESPAPRSWKRRAARSRRVVRRSLQRADIMSHDTKRCILLEMDTSNTKGEIGSAFSLLYEGGRAYSNRENHNFERPWGLTARA